MDWRQNRCMNAAFEIFRAASSVSWRDCFFRNDALARARCHR